MSPPTSQATKHSDVLVLETRKTDALRLKEKRQRDRKDLRNKIVNNCDSMKKLPGMDALIVLRYQWKGGEEQWIYNSIETTENQWNLPLKDFVNECDPPIRPLNPAGKKIMITNKASIRKDGVVKQKPGIVKKKSVHMASRKQSTLRQRLANIKTTHRGFPGLPEVATSPAIVESFGSLEASSSWSL